MATKAANKRLNKEYVAMQKEPPPFVWACPEEKNILNWHFIIRGPPDSPFDGGEYHGVLLFPSEYPFKPPGIKMFTPSGRFHPDKKICFSMSDFHPASWNPAWSVATILTGLLSFMLSDEMTTGSVNSTDAHKRVFASRSHAWNLKQKRFQEIFPDFCTTEMKDLPNMGITPSPSESDASSSPPNTVTSSIATPQTQSPSISTQAEAGGIVSNKTNASGQTVITVTGSGQPPRPMIVRANPNASTGDDPESSDCSWGQMLWAKWQWGVLILFAVVISKLSSASA
jgi:ubiquitin-conjugating enzyme E2 J2